MTWITFSFTATNDSTRWVDQASIFNVALIWITCQYTETIASSKCVDQSLLLTSYWLGIFLNLQWQTTQPSALTRRAFNIALIWSTGQFTWPNHSTKCVNLTRILTLHWLGAIVQIQGQSPQPSPLNRRVLFTSRWIGAPVNVLSTKTFPLTKYVE